MKHKKIQHDGFGLSLQYLCSATRDRWGGVGQIAEIQVDGQQVLHFPEGLAPILATLTDICSRDLSVILPRCKPKVQQRCCKAKPLRRRDSRLIFRWIQRLAILPQTAT